MPLPSGVTIQQVPLATAGADAEIRLLAALINAAYAVSEADITAAGVERITAGELRRRIRDGELYASYASGTIVGVVRLHYMPERSLDTAYGPGREYGVLNDLWDEAAPEGHEGIEHSPSKTLATFSMLAVHAKYANKGLGNGLVKHLEDTAREQGCRAMEIQLQEPLEPPMGFSEVLRAWYARRGYVQIRDLTMEEFLPGFKECMVVPVKLVVMRKVL